MLCIQYKFSKLKTVYANIFSFQPLTLTRSARAERQYDAKKLLFLRQGTDLCIQRDGPLSKMGDFDCNQTFHFPTHHCCLIIVFSSTF